MRVAIIDNGSALLEELRIAVFRALNVEPELIKYPDLSVKAYDLLIFSGRAIKNSQTDVWMHKLLKHYGNLPSVFICYAAEFFNLSRGGTLRKLSNHLYGYYDITFEKNSVGIPPGKHAVYESRSLSIGRLGRGLRPIAAGNGIEAFLSDNGQLGLMFHPEKSDDFGLTVLRSYFKWKYF
jgi:GMP synthase-like glutamine amidotransferase